MNVGDTGAPNGNGHVQVPVTGNGYASNQRPRDSNASSYSLDPNTPQANALKAKLLSTLQSRGIKPKHMEVYESWLSAVGPLALARGEIRFNSSLDTFEHRAEAEPGHAAITLKTFLESFEGLPREKLRSPLGRFEQLVEECEEVQSFRFWFLLRNIGGRNPTIDR